MRRNLTTADGGYSATREVTVIESVIAVTGIIPDNGQVNVKFAIESANGKGYFVFISESGEHGPYELYINVNYNSKGAHIKDMINDEDYFVYIEYRKTVRFCSEASRYWSSRPRVDA